MHKPAHCAIQLIRELIFPVWYQVPEEPIYTEFINATLYTEDFSSVFSIS